MGRPKFLIDINEISFTPVPRKIKSLKLKYTLKTLEYYVVNDDVINFYVMVFAICKYVSIHFHILKFLPAWYPSEEKDFTLHVGISVRGWRRNIFLFQSIKNNYDAKPTCFLLGILSPFLRSEALWKPLHSSLPSVKVKNARSYTAIPSIYVIGVVPFLKQNLIIFCVIHDSCLVEHSKQYVA